MCASHGSKDGHGLEAPKLSLAQAAVCSGWPRDILEDFCKWPIVADSPQSFLNFVMYGNHSQAQMCVLPNGLRQLGLEESLPKTLMEACQTHRDAIEAVLATESAFQGDLDGDVFVWGDQPGEAGCRRREIKEGSLRERLEEAKRVASDQSLMYMAELSRGTKSPHHLTGERSRTLTSRDVRDLDFAAFGCEDVELPMWDRGHAFVGANGAGSCLHVDQAWWSNISKNFAGYKLVALWGPGASENALKLSTQLFRRPLSKEQTDALRQASTIALLGPGDVASFTGGLPHVTLVVGDMLNLTAYESLINWHPCNADLLLRGALRKPGSEGVMKRKALHGLFDDIVQVVRRRVPEALDLHRKGGRRRVVLIPLGSTNDHQGVVDGEVWHRAKKTVSLWKSLKSAGSDVQILMSGGADTSRFFNPLETSHWRFVREVLLHLGVPSAELPDGLEALHTVDEALMSRAHCLDMKDVDTVDLLVITSEFHVARARHLFNVALRDVPSVEVLVLAVPNACDGEKLEAYLKKERETMKCLRQKPYGAWLDFLREHHAEAVNESHQQCEPFVMSSHRADLLRSAFRDTLRCNKSCRRRLASKEEVFDSSSSRSGDETSEVRPSKDCGVDHVQKKPRIHDTRSECR